MMKKILLFSILSFLLSCKTQQASLQKNQTKNKEENKEVKVDYLKYFDLIGEASNLYKLQNYKESSEKYEEAFKAINYNADTSDRYNAACSNALANNNDKAFFHLFYIAKNEKFTKLEKLNNDKNLISLHNDKRWQKLIGIVKKNKEIVEKDFNRELVAELDTIFQNDQNCRAELMFANKKYGKDSNETKSLTKKCIEFDSINQIKVSRILDEHGWLGKNIIGEKGNLTLFLVLQHSDRNIDMQLKYLPLLKDAVKKGMAKPAHLAMLEDRTRLKQGKKQIYGSQIGKDEVTGKYYVKPIEDPINVDKRRAEVGLGKLADYLKNWNIVWDVNKHIDRISKKDVKKKRNK